MAPMVLMEPLGSTHPPHSPPVGTDPNLDCGNGSSAGIHLVVVPVADEGGIDALERERKLCEVVASYR